MKRFILTGIFFVGLLVFVAVNFVMKGIRR